ncbi:conjugal transfer protein [Streptomyces sp. ASQP_92]|uniref:conjugal transfer protein n=1 Tax=Streptomyces sp. ASQP_92 TaxID=2979116 RepID=UPI0021C023C0|nr:conjugal transfer protein [Streptomyces sp. ASQP_92]MCT9093901.1 conjugal transfer protein [Streptomyces sp. ASQP_92]
MSLGTIARKVMGLPEPTGKNGTGENPTAAVPRQAEETPPRPVNPWESAGAELRQQTATGKAGNGTRPAPSRTSSGTPWTPQDERSGAVFLRRLGRGLVWFVVVLAAITGVRAWFIPPKAPAPKAPAVKTEAAYPEEAAQAVAARFARAYLGWDESKVQEREQLLAAVLPPDADTTMGWNGHGRQDVLAVQPGAVTKTNNAQARVRVEALVRPVAGAEPAKDKAATPAQEAARWVGLDVPVAESAGQIVVTGRPGLVGIPKHGPKAPDTPTTQTDPELSTQTNGAVDKFFAAYAAGDTDAVTAPGASVPALPAGVEYKGLVSWSADTGSGDRRTGTALVSWSLGGASVEQVYRVTITRVSTSDAHRWQVYDVRGGSA